MFHDARLHFHPCRHVCEQHAGQSRAGQGRACMQSSMHAHLSEHRHPNPCVWQEVPTTNTYTANCTVDQIESLQRDMTRLEGVKLANSPETCTDSPE